MLLCSLLSFFFNFLILIVLFIFLNTLPLEHIAVSFIPKSIPKPFVFMLVTFIVSSISIISDKKYLSAILVIVPLFILAFLGMYPYSFTLKIQSQFYYF